MTKTGTKRAKPVGLDRITSCFTKIKVLAETSSKALGRWEKSAKGNPEMKTALDELVKCAADAVSCSNDAFTFVKNLKDLGFQAPVQKPVEPLRGKVVVRSEFVAKYSGITAGEELDVVENGPGRSGVFVQTQDNARLFILRSHLVPNGTTASA